MRIFVSLFASSFAQSILTLTGDYGEFLECPYGYVMSGYCSSGNKKDCDYNNSSYSHLIECREDSRITLDFADRCYWAYGDFEDLNKCLGPDELAVGACSSGSNSDCNKNASAIHCCALKTLTVNQSSCAWDYPSNYGEFRKCPQNKWARGVCTVGRWASESCGGYGKGALYCCSTTN
ncbi:unnamed protein product [Oikopleura dioica]|uniref:Uncharacterized protein n=1 Tax=Oikopleura dioica TaxID=34765 RepID=E4YJ41_OIKDI|nr:unnamed protein product [Oikopleura dioica]